MEKMQLFRYLKTEFELNHKYFIWIIRGKCNMSIPISLYLVKSVWSNKCEWTLRWTCICKCYSMSWAIISITIVRSPHFQSEIYIFSTTNIFYPFRIYTVQYMYVRMKHLKNSCGMKLFYIIFTKFYKPLTRI